MQTESLKVTGMNSEQCADNVINALRAIQGVDDVNVSLLRSQADVRFDERRVTLPKLQEALAQAGYGSGAATARDEGSCCGGCCS